MFLVIFAMEKLWIVVPGYVSVMGPLSNRHRHLSPGIRMVAKGSRKSAIIPLCQISTQQTFFFVKELSQSWLTSCCLRTVSR
jgi:hypothetical protein